MIIQRTQAVGGSLFNLSDVMDHARLSDTYFLAEAQRLALAAAREFEAYAQLALLDQTITVTIDEPIRCAMLALPIAPLIDVLSVQVTVDGVAFDDFAVIAGLRPALRFTDEKPSGLVVIQYLAGFGSSDFALPADIRHAIADQATANFETKGAGDGKTNGLSPHMARIAARYRRVAL